MDAIQVVVKFVIPGVEIFKETDEAFSVCIVLGVQEVEKSRDCAKQRKQEFWGLLDRWQEVEDGGGNRGASRKPPWV